MNDIVNMIDKYLNDFYYLKSFKKNVNEFISIENHYLEIISILEHLKYELERSLENGKNL